MTDDSATNTGIEVSVVMPCLNEEQAIGQCIAKAQQALAEIGASGEIVVADNGSTDGSVSIAQALGARVVHQPVRGYGSAYKKGFEAARGRYIVMADSDGTYNLAELPKLLEPLRNGKDFVIGSRVKGRILPGATPWLHRRLGVPILTWLLNRVSGARISDAHCGMRAFRREAYARMRLQATGMEFASEMVVKAARARLRVAEVPIEYHPRIGDSKLRTFSDGWRHFRFLLLYSPTHLFLLPGLFLFGLGLAILLALVSRPLHIGGANFNTHYMLLGSLLSLLGYQVVTLGLFGKVYGATHQFVPEDPLIRGLLRHFNLERGLLLGLAVFAVGLGMNIYILVRWIGNDFGPLMEVRLGLLALTLSVIGVQIVFSSFFLSVLGIKRG